MKTVLLTLLLLVTGGVSAQIKYPSPPQHAHSLFYIQHSDNTNTYVYELNAKDRENPIKVYRILYAEDQSSRELTALQRKMAYGVTIQQRHAHGCTFTLAATKNQLFNLHFAKGKPVVTTQLQGRELQIQKLFVEMSGKNGEFISKPLAIVFSGTDLQTRKKVQLRISAEHLK